MRTGPRFYLSAGTAITLLLALTRCGGGFYTGLLFTPSSGPVGTMVTLSGMNFPASQSTSIQSVSVGGQSAVVLGQASTSIQTMVMPSTVNGAIQAVTNNNSVLSSSSTFTVLPAGVPANQQGAKLLATDMVGGAANLGASVAISADGNTVVAGGSGDNGGVGATWVFTRSGSTWTQFGSKLVASDAINAAGQGTSVAISADGNTLASGGIFDNGGSPNGIGATWIWTRSGNAWSEQVKLVGTGYIGGPVIYQGSNVALSADGNILASTAMFDNGGNPNGIGATWIFARSGSTWTQVAKLVGTSAVTSNQGNQALSLSADGSTLAVGGFADNANVGAVWIFSRSGSTWTQQSKIVSPGSTCGGNAGKFGSGAALSGDGNTLLVGMYNDGGTCNSGAAVVYTRSGGVWTQQGAKLTASNALGAGPFFGKSVALSADGNTALITGSGDNTNVGAVWVFTRSGTTWTQVNKLIGTGYSGAVARQGYGVAITADGYTAVSGGKTDNTTVGALWIFTN